MKTLIRVEGLDAMIVAPYGPEAVIRNISSLVPSAVGPEDLLGRTKDALRRIWNVEPTDSLPADADYLVRVDSEKILIRVTSQEYQAAPSWANAPLLAVIPTPGSKVREWHQGDPSLRSLRSLSEHLSANKGLGESLRANLLNIINQVRP